jgi:hypothetical protein
MGKSLKEVSYSYANLISLQGAFYNKALSESDWYCKEALKNSIRELI